MSVRLFESIVGSEGVLTKTEDLAFYGHDWCKEFSPRPGCIVLPRSVDEVTSVVHCARQHRLAIVPSGGRTGLSGGATAANGEVVVSLERMNRVLSHDPVGMTLSCQAGVTLEALRNFAAERDFYYPIDIASKGSCQIGGTVATNAGGIRVIRYGNTRDWILGLTVVTGAGEVLRLNGALYKNQSGYDLRSLFIGSEGTLGIVVEAIVKLAPPPPEPLLALVAIEGPESALAILQELRLTRLGLQVFEYFESNALTMVLQASPGTPRPFPESYPAYVLMEVEKRGAQDEDRLHEFLHDVSLRGMARSVVLAQNTKHYQDLMGLRERISESISKRSFPHKNDVSVPIASLAECLRELKAALARGMPNSESVIFGHFGDGNLHINVIKPDDSDEKSFIEQAHAMDRTVFEIVARYSGSVSAEHGVGLLKKDFLHYSRSSDEIRLMKSIKKVFDPDGIMNPGKIFDEAG